MNSSRYHRHDRIVITGCIIAAFFLSIILMVLP
jgi:hypothetical protein